MTSLEQPKMITKNAPIAGQKLRPSRGEIPALNVTRIGIVSRNYSHKYKNGLRDFSDAFPAILALLDGHKCDAVLFSLYSIISRKSFDPLASIRLKNIKAVLYEEFVDGKKRKKGRYVVAHRKNDKWHEYELSQAFGTLTGNKQKVEDFIRNETQWRILGNFFILLCGESNGVKYSRIDKSVHDVFGLRRAIPKRADVVLNPIHDRMTRFEMKLKRAFFSQEGRWVISVWNKGKKDCNGKVKDGSGPAWTVFHNGKELKNIVPISKEFGVEIGIVDISERLKVHWMAD
jgi:hypothetical protein